MREWTKCPCEQGEDHLKFYTISVFRIFQLSRRSSPSPFGVIPLFALGFTTQ